MFMILRGGACERKIFNCNVSCRNITRIGIGFNKELYKYFFKLKNYNNVGSNWNMRLIEVLCLF